MAVVAEDVGECGMGYSFVGVAVVMGVELPKFTPAIPYDKSAVVGVDGVSTLHGVSVASCVPPGVYSPVRWRLFASV